MPGDSHLSTRPVPSLVCHRCVSVGGGAGEGVLPGGPARVLTSLRSPPHLSSLVCATGNLEVNVVGDFDPEELERCLLRFVGTVAPRPAELCSPMTHVAHQILAPPFDQRHTVWHLQVRGVYRI